MPLIPQAANTYYGIGAQGGEARKTSPASSTRSNREDMTRSFGPSFSDTGPQASLRIPRYALPHEELSTLNNSYSATARSSPRSAFTPSTDALSGSTQVQSPISSIALDLPLCDATSPGSAQRLYSTSDFTALGRLGKGAHGDVLLVRDSAMRKHWALKVVEKDKLHLTSYPRIFEEQLVGKKLVNSPWALHLEGSFQDNEYFYFLSKYHPAGDLTKFVRRYGKLPTNIARWYAAELIVAMEELHLLNVMHRDIKPDNILLDDEGHLLLADFGVSRSFNESCRSRPWERYRRWAKTSGKDSRSQSRSPSPLPVDQDQCERTCTSCGTPGFMAPETYGDTGYSYEADIWSAGVVIHFLLMGRLPFGMIPAKQSFKELSTRTKVLQLEFGTDERVPGHARTLLRRMLEKDPSRRISVAEIKQHSFFTGLSWDAVRQKKATIEFPLVLSYLHQKENHMTLEDGVTIPSGTSYKQGESPYPWFDYTAPPPQEDVSPSPKMSRIAKPPQSPTTPQSGLHRKASLAQKFKGLWKRSPPGDHSPRLSTS
ncbi:hypothetical protein NM688_g1339 [Phlebia brevispora]|uniref:Uncharacterized protein n=1 Tax=Phlebia brevispora TaxID=194682 RepID=A0ACC1TBM4_9APHY|nr:hypothetical protein NM688_g1339 [Phlebia brevispora]